MLDWFARLSDPFVDAPVVRPPDRMMAFYRYFLAPVRGLLVAIVIVSLLSSLAEMALLVFLGVIVDWATETPPAEFFSRYGWALAGMGFVILVIRPVTAILSRGLTSITFVPSLTALVRWRSYRYVLRQSLAFFQNDFAGRIAQKVLQSGPALRESVVNVVEGVFTLVIYLVGTIVLFAGLDPWLILPVALWGVAYAITICAHGAAGAGEVRGGGRGQFRALRPHRRQLHQHPVGEALCPCRARGDLRQGGLRPPHHGVPRPRRLDHDDDGRRSTSSTACSSSRSAGCRSGCGRSARSASARSPLANALVIRLNQMSGWILRTITSLFENIGTLENAIETISRPQEIIDRPDAEPLVVTRGEIRFEDVHFHYGREGGIIEGLSLSIAPGEKVGLVGRSGAGKSTLVNLLLRFYDLESGRILIDRPGRRRP